MIAAAQAETASHRNGNVFENLSKILNAKQHVETANMGLQCTSQFSHN